MKNIKNKSDLIFSLDIGTRSVIGTVCRFLGDKFEIVCESYVEHNDRAMIDGQIHDINKVTDAVRKVVDELESNLDSKLENVAIAAAGRFLRTVLVKEELKLEEDREITQDIIKTLELSSVQKGEREIEKSFKSKLYCVGYSVKSYYLNGYIISNLLGHTGNEASVETICTFLPRSVIDSLYKVMDNVGLKVSNITLEPIAAIEAVLPENLRLLNIALVDIGAGTSDIAISSNNTVNAFGMVPMAGDEVTEVIAQNYLTDFNTAENIKRQINESEQIIYTDVLGFENEIGREELLKLVRPMVDKIANEISSKILELNGEKSPSAVFLVGGGANTPLLKELLCEKLNLPHQRVGIKDRKSVTSFTESNNDMGSVGVTVLGIALWATKSSSKDFMTVSFNNSPVTLFNSQKNSIGDVLVQTGVELKTLLGKKGKSIRFTLNNISRVAIGELPKHPEILLNSNTVSIDTIVSHGDNIEVNVAKNGKDAEPKVKDYIKTINSITCYVDEELICMEPIILKNSSEISVEDSISEGDNIEIIYPNDIVHLKRYFLKDESSVLCKEDTILDDSYVIKEGDYLKKQNNTTSDLENIEVAIDNERSDIVNENRSTDNITIKVNQDEIKLNGKDKYIFVDVFNYIEFDLSKPKGALMMTLNDKKAGYYDELSDGDSIKIYWE